MKFEDAQLPCLPQTAAGNTNGAPAAANKRKALDSFLAQLQRTAAVGHDSLLWSEAAAAEAYDAVLNVEKSGWTSVKACKQFASALQHQGNLCIKHLTTTEHRSDTAASSALALTVFFTCHVLQRTEVRHQHLWKERHIPGLVSLYS